MLKAWIGTFLKPGNLAGGFAYYQAAHAGRVAIMREQAPVLPPIGVPTCMRWAEHDPLRERGQDRVFRSDQMASSGGRGMGQVGFSGTIPQVINS